MIDKPWSRAWWLAVGPRLDRGVRPHAQSDLSPYPIGNEYIEITLLMANAIAARDKNVQGAL